MSVDSNTVPYLSMDNQFTNVNTFRNQLLVTPTTAIAATSQTTGALVVNGGVGISGDMYVSSTYNMSDERLKENVVTLDGALDQIMQLKGCEYVWNENEVNREAGRVGAPCVGVIAQDVVNAGMKNVTTEDPSTGLLAVEYTRLIPYLIESIKTLKRKVDELTAAGSNEEAAAATLANEEERRLKKRSRASPCATDGV